MSQKARERKRLERERLAREAKTKLGFRGTWEYRTLRFLFKFFIASALLFYLGLGGSLTWTWLHTKYVRLQPVEKAAEIAQKLLKPGGDPEYLRSWVAMRPTTDGDALMKLLDPYIEWMNGMTFIVYGSWMADQGKMEEAVFWRQYARFRIRFDALRCGSHDAPSLVTRIMNQFPQPAIRAYMQDHPELQTKILRQVLDFDAKHLPVNDPTEFCKALVAGEEYRYKMQVEMQPRHEWRPIHDTLRGVSYYEILHMEEEAKEEAGEGGEKRGAAARKAGKGLQRAFRIFDLPEEKRRP